MEISEVFPPSGHLQRLFCDLCNSHLDLIYKDFSETVSGITVQISGLPYLHCPCCERDVLPDNSRAAIIRLWEQAKERNLPGVKIKERSRYKISDSRQFLSNMTRTTIITFLG